MWLQSSNEKKNSSVYWCLLGVSENNVYGDFSTILLLAYIISFEHVVYVLEWHACPCHFNSLLLPLKHMTGLPTNEAYWKICFVSGLVADIDIESEKYRWMGSARIDFYVRLHAIINMFCRLVPFQLVAAAPAIWLIKYIIFFYLCWMHWKVDAWCSLNDVNPEIETSNLNWIFHHSNICFPFFFLTTSYSGK